MSSDETIPLRPRPSAEEHLGALLAAAGRGSEAELIAVATRLLTGLLGERGSCLLLGSRPRVVMSTHAPSVRNWPIDLTNYPEILAAVEERRVIAVEDVLVDPRLAAVRPFLPRSLRSTAVVPLLGTSEVLGVVLVQSTAPRRFIPRALELPSLIGQQAALLIELARLQFSLAKGAAGEVAAAARRDRALSGPVVLAEAEESTLRLHTQREPPPAASRILVIDDDSDDAALVGQILADQGYAVETCSDSLDGVKRARERRPDAVIVDVCLPRLDGFGVVEKLRAEEATRETPVLFVSGCDDLMVRVQGLKLGAADFLTKPFFAPELLARVERSIEQSKLRARLSGQAHTDELTGLGNVRFLREQMALEQSRVKRYRTRLSVVMIDVDKLKRINDAEGHPVGSRVLAEVGRILREEVRETDVAVRYGGDEFLVMLPHVALADGVSFAERVLARARATAVGEGVPRILLSCGVASLDGDEGVEEVLRKADVAAYHAKRRGGNQVRAYDLAIDTAVARGRAERAG
jgi:diguanylate cyclase (GGDEF)-like protein